MNKDEVCPGLTEVVEDGSYLEVARSGNRVLCLDPKNRIQNERTRKVGRLN